MSSETMVRTLDGDHSPSSFGTILTHEHVYADFGTISGDDDLNFTDIDGVSHDLAILANEGVNTIVEVSTYDMGNSVITTARICRAQGIRVIKSTGWFRSPYADKIIRDISVKELTDRLITDIEEGFGGTALRAGVIGEVGIQGERCTAVEQRVLSAAVDASLQTGAGVITHTDTWPNAALVVRTLLTLGLPADRIIAGHLRCADPVGGQTDMALMGVTLGFDQVGHPERDGIEGVSARIETLVESGVGNRIVISADQGRRSRLTKNGGTGYAHGITELLLALQRGGLNGTALSEISGSNAAEFLALRARA